MSEEMYSYKYPHPAVTTDCVIFGYDGTDLHILLVERGLEPYKGMWALPGGFLNMNETVEECARRELQEETNVSEVFLEQFHVFSDVNRDPRERVLTVAFYALVRKSDYKVIGGDDATRAQWFLWNELPPLAFDHDKIIDMALSCLREKIRMKPIAFKLLDKKFTMPELQRLCEVVMGKTYDRRNFQKKLLSTGYFEEKGISKERTANRPPKLFSFREKRFFKKVDTDDDINPFDL
jgi:8-oxo-dGTP diphosphatase